MQNISREFTYGNDAKMELLEGVNIVCDIVGSTMGYRGSNVFFEGFNGDDAITKDGKDSLFQIHLSDPIMNMAVNQVKQACKKTFTNVGDNTTATCVLLQAFFQNSLEAIKNGKNAIEVSREILESVEKIVEYLDSIAIPLDKKLTYDVAKTAGNADEELAKTVSDAFEQAGVYGTVSHGRSFTDETIIKHIDGNPLEKGYIHEGFVNKPESQTVVYDNPLVVVSGTHFQTFNEIVQYLTVAFPPEGSNLPRRPLIFVASMDDNLSATLLEIYTKQGFPLCHINPPYAGKKGRENLSDLALILGSEVVDGIINSDGTKTLDYIGTCDKIVVSASDTVFTLNPNIDKTKITARINELKEQIKITTNEHEKTYLNERIGKIVGGISTILVGGITPSETEERIARYDDAICAVRAAKEEGIVAGGGIALINAFRELELDEVTDKSIQSTFKKIISNAKCVELIDIKEYPIGYDVKEYKEVNMIDAGIIDTVKGVKNSLINAVSASNNLLRCEYVLPYTREKNGK